MRDRARVVVIGDGIAGCSLLNHGYRALDMLRLEKGCRLWGADLTSEDTPLEAGLERFVRFEKGPFLGREALLRPKERGVQWTLVCLAIDAGDAFPWGSEPVLDDDRVVGYVRSGGYGPTVGTTLALAYLPPGCGLPGTRLNVELLGERQSATVVTTPLADPDNRRLRS